MNHADSPIFADLFLGGGAVWLALLGLDLVPLCSWMGGKRREAGRILRALGLRPGRMLLGQRDGERIPCLLGDASWWGWVWPVVLDPVEGPRVDVFLRSWRAEDPRALWFRLRDLGPVTDDVAHATAQLLWLQARAASGVPVWWEGAGTWKLGIAGWEYSEAAAPPELTKWDRTRRGNRGPANQAHANEPELLASPGDGRERQRAYERSRSTPSLVQERGWKSPTCSTYKLFEATQGNADEVREERRERRAPLIHQHPNGSMNENQGKGTNSTGGGGIVDPGTIAARSEAIRARLTCAHRVPGPASLGGLLSAGVVADRADRIRAAVLGDTTILNHDARAVTEAWAARVGPRGRVYLDPPYQGKTGYPATCPREDVLWIAEEWARHGARVVLSEAVGLAGELGAGWIEEQIRDGEWITCFGCEPEAVRAVAARGAA